MPQTFCSNVQTATRSNGGSTDSTPVPCGALSTGGIATPGGIAGAPGIDVALVHGDQWQTIEKNRTEKILQNLKMTVTLDEDRVVEQNTTSKIVGDYTFSVIGKTTDTRTGVHHQANVSARFENYFHTLTQDHHEKMVIHQPTTTWDIVNTYFTRKTLAFAVSASEFAAKGTVVEMRGVDTACKVVSIENKVFALKKDSFSLKDLDVGLHIRGIITEIKAVKIKAAASHVKAIGANLCAGIALNLDSPWA